MDQSRRARDRRQAAARAARDEDKSRKETRRQRSAAERYRREMREQQRLEEATVRTEQIEQRLQKLMVLLRAALKRLPGKIDFEAMKKPLPEPVGGVEDEPFPPPRWEEYAPAATGALGRLVNRQRQAARLEEAESAYAHALERYRIAEADRRRRVDQLRSANGTGLSRQEQEILAHNKGIDDFAEQVFAADRHAVSRYFERAFRTVTDKLPGPGTRRMAYVPESKVLAIEWHVPGIEIVPREKEFRYNADRDAIEVARWRSMNRTRDLYHNVLAQLALRGVAGAFNADPHRLVEAVVFNAMAPPDELESLPSADQDVPPDEADQPDQADRVSTTDDAAGRTDHTDRADPTGRGTMAEDAASDQPSCVFSMRVTRRQFEKIKLEDLTDTEPLELVERRFAARLSPYPEDQAPVTPLLPYELAEPTGGDPDHDCQLDLNGVNTAELDHLIADLLESMGYSVEVIQPDDEDCDLLATVPTADGQERVLVHLRRVQQLAGSVDVRGIVRALRRERADSGILMVTGGFDGRAFEYAAGKPVLLYDAHAVLCLLHLHGLAESAESGSEVCVPTVPRQRIRLPVTSSPG